MIKSFLLLTVSALCVLLSAAEYFVAPSGSDSNQGTREKPFATFKKGLSRLKAGDTLTLAPGDYTGAGNMTITGTAEKPVTVRAEIPGTVVIRGDRVVKGFKKCAGELFIYEIPWSEPTGGVKERDTMSWYNPVNSFQLLKYNRAAWFHDTEKKMLYIVTSDGNPPDSHLVTVCTGDPKEGHGLQLVGKSRFVNFEGLNFTGFDSYIVKWGDRYYSVKSLLLNHSENIKVTNCRFFLNGCGLTFWNCRNALVENCTAYANHSLAVGSAANIYFTGRKTANCTVRNCTAFNSALSGIRFYSGPFNNSVIERCVAWGHGMSDLEIKAPDQSCIIRESLALHNATNTNVRNNILSTNSFRLTPESDPTSLYYRQKSVSGLVSSNLADFDNFDGRPMSDSVLKGGLPYDKSVFFLSPKGDDKNSGTTIRAPRRSLKNIPDGATVYLMPGKYAHLTVTQKNLTLAGRGRYTKAFVAGLTVTGSNVTCRKINFAGNVSVSGKGNAFENCSFAKDLLFKNASDFRVTHCAFVTGRVKCSNSSGAVFSNILSSPVTGSAKVYSDNNAYPVKVPAGEPRSIVCKALFNAPEKGDFTLKNAEAFAGYALDAFPIGPYNRLPEGTRSDIHMARVHRVTSDSAEIEWYLPTGKERCFISWKSENGKIQRAGVTGEVFRNVTLTGLKPGTKYVCTVSSSNAAKECFLNIEPGKNRGVVKKLEFTTPLKPAAPQEYFVSVKGSDKNPGSKEKPFRTIAYALGKISPGDTVTVREGVYTENLIFRVSDMTLRGMPGEMVWLDGKRKLLNFISFYNKRNITVDNFRFRGVITTKREYIRCVNSSNIKLSRIFIDGRWSNGYSPTPLYALSCKNLLFENCVTMNSFRGLHFIASDDITIRNCVLSMNSLNQIHFNEFAPNAKAVVEKNIICDMIPVKFPNAIIHLPHTHSGLKIENNCFYIRTTPDKRNFVGTWLGVGSGFHPIAHYRQAHPGRETNIFRDPLMPGLKLHKMPVDNSFKEKEYRATPDGKSWEVLDFKDFFPADAEVRRRGMGLREAEVR